MKSTAIHATPLAYFLEVAERGSLSGASKSLHVAVSAISRQITRLEEDLGIVLFDRDARGMRLTEAGAVVREFGSLAVLDAEALRAELRGLASLRDSSVRVACSDGFAHDYLPSVIAAFQRRHPGVRFSLDVGAPADVTRKVRAGEVDLALSFAIAAQEGIQVEHSEIAPVYALVARSHPVAGLKRVTLAQLMSYPLVLPTGANTIRQLFDLACGLGGLKPNIRMTSNSLAALNAYPLDGESISLCGSLSVRNRLRAQKRVLVPLADAEMQRRSMQVQSLARRRLPPAVRAFVDHLVADITGPRPRTTGR